MSQIQPLSAQCAVFGCSIPKLKEQGRQRFGSHSSTKQKPKILPFGHLIALFATMISAPRKAKMANGSKNLLSTFLSLFCLLSLFASSARNATIGSHNLHSFKQSAAYHKSCIQKFGGIWFSQELWLSEKQLSAMQELGTQFVARSGMEQSLSDRLMLGRPYGGVGISWSPDLDHLVLNRTSAINKLWV